MNGKSAKTSRSATRKWLQRETQNMPSVSTRDFRRLGLSVGETRAEWIRAALTKASRSIASSSVSRFPERLDRQISLLAFSAYCLLDPRRRVDLMQRVQLVYPIGREELEVPSLEGRSLTNIPSRPLGGEQASRTSPEVNPEIRETSTREWRGESTESLEGWVAQIVDGVTSDSLEESRAIVRLIRSNGEEEKSVWSQRIRRWIGVGSSGLVVSFALFSTLIAGRGQRTSQASLASSSIANSATHANSSPSDEWVEGSSSLVAAAAESENDEPAGSAVGSSNSIKVGSTEGKSTAEVPGIIRRVPLPEVSALVSWTGPSLAAIRESQDRLESILDLMARTVEPVLDDSRKLQELECLAAEAPQFSADRWVLLESLSHQTTRVKGLESGLEVSDRLDREFQVTHWKLKMELIELASVRSSGLTDHRLHSEIALRLARQAVSSSEFLIGQRLTHFAGNAAAKSKDLGMICQVQQFQDELSGLQASPSS